MANFTINSLTAANTTASHQFIKSDSNGVLTKESGQDLANDLAALAGLTPVARTANLTFGSVTLPTTFYKLGRVLIISILGPSLVSGTFTNWTTAGAIPDGIGQFGSCGIAIPGGSMIMVRNYNGNLQFQTSLTSFWAQGAGVALASA